MVISVERGETSLAVIVWEHHRRAIGLVGGINGDGGREEALRKAWPGNIVLMQIVPASARPFVDQLVFEKKRCFTIERSDQVQQSRVARQRGAKRGHVDNRVKGVK